MKYFLVAGEASGDLHASNLMKALKVEDPEAEFCFMGGDKMAEVAGFNPVIHYRDMAYMGILQVLMHMQSISRAAKVVREAIRKFQPDVIIPVDYGGFNMKYILPFASKENIFMSYYIIPKVWAWRRWRMKKLCKYTDLALSILPFEEEYFSSFPMKTVYVGNPCMDALSEVLGKHPDYSILPDDGEDKRPIIALLAGSRKQELKDNLPLMLSVAEAYKDYRFVVAGAPGLKMNDYAPYLKSKSGHQIEVVFDSTYKLLQLATAALVTSGTATLETGLIGCPQVVCYKSTGGKLLNFIFNNFFPISYFSLVNLITDREVVPELLGADCTVSNIKKQLFNILPGHKGRDQQHEGYNQLRQKIGSDGCSRRAAKEIVTAYHERLGRL